MGSAANGGGPRAEECVLRLAPGSARGWFGGEGLAVSGTAEVAEGVSLAEAARALEDAFEGRGDCGLVAVLAAYDGSATVVRWREAAEGTHAAAPGGHAASVGPPASTATAEAQATRVPPTAPAGAPLCVAPVASASALEFRARVRAVREAIAAGDVYVLNLTYQLAGVAAADGPETFEALRERASSDMNAYLETRTRAVASVSPERFVRVRATADGRIAEIWPIKGTRPRGADPATDAALAAELAASEKERAEHVMVVDMERNDLGRVSEPGSVVADPLLEVVPTPYCHQMVSRVHGVLRADATFAELLEATFPCGSVTGAPKHAAIRIAATLERGERGLYTGALLVARAGELDSSVLIRTAVLAGGRVTWGIGGGITIDSDPAEEYLETLLKASPLTGDGSPAVALRETCRVVGGAVPLLAYHLARLAAGGCGPSQLARVRARVAETLEAAATEAPTATAPTARRRLAVTAHPDGSVDAELTDRPSSLDVPGGPVLVTVPVAAAPPLPAGAAKPADRTLWDAVQASAGPDAQAVLVGPDGRIVDGATASVWVRRGESLLTPPAPFAVAGVAREVVFDLAEECGYSAAEAPLLAEDLSSADEVFFTNAYAGVVAARDREGLAAERLAAAFEQRYG